ncbi:MAG: HAD hydrolase family protein, partial [Clostridia bacterium]|nr:HAD hydrolase family protein [Clostridia bacterium]
PLNAPSILDNGGVLYDVRGRRFIDCTYIPREKSLEVVNRLIEISPTASVQVYTCDARYQVNLNPERIEDPLVGLEGINEPLCRAEDVPGEWIKIVICEPEELLMRTLGHLDIDALNKEFATVLSGKLYFEFFSLGMSKGRGIDAIREKEPSAKKILAIGDYYNDMEMLKKADVSCAPANAEQDIKDVVDYVVCDNNSGAVADFLRIALGIEI